MVQIDEESAEPVMRRIGQLELKDLEEYARRLLEEFRRHKEESGTALDIH